MHNPLTLHLGSEAVALATNTVLRAMGFGSHHCQVSPPACKLRDCSWLQGGTQRSSAAPWSLMLSEQGRQGLPITADCPCSSWQAGTALAK